MNEDESFFVGQKAFIRKGDDVLVIHDPIEGLDFPGGKIQIGEENTLESLKREVREETGLEIEVGHPFATWIRIMPAQHRHAGKKVYLVAFKADLISGDIKLSHEHDKFTWVNKDSYHTVNDCTQYFEILEKYFKD
jgi:8-oxo-dGTP diphosphatase